MCGPIYQRTYSWTERECRQLWDDIVRTGSNDAVSAHFVGSIVYIEKGLYQVSSQSPLLVIDGQQRLTTVTLILEALARQLGDSEPVDGFSAKKLRSYYVLNPLEEGERGFKLLLTQTDKASLLALVQQKAQPTDQSLRVTENFAFFEEQVQNLGADLPALCHGLAKLVVVDIALSRDQDNPQLIFESMNSTGRELSQADLIRNFILMGLDPAHQTRLYEDHWRPMDCADFWIDNDEQVRRLAYCYTSVPSVLTPDRSQPHDGAMLFEIIGEPAQKLRGNYWTTRKTTGEVTLTFRCRERLDDLPDHFGSHPMEGK